MVRPAESLLTGGLSTGIRAAFAEHNSVSKPRLTLSVRDTGSAAGGFAAATANARAMASEEEEGLFGFIGSELFDTAGDPLLSAVPNVGPTSSSSVVRVRGSAAINLRPSIPDRVSNALSYLALDFAHLQRTALFVDASVPGAEARAEATAALRGTYGLEPLAVETLLPEHDLSAAVSRLSAAKPLSVLIASSRHRLVAEFAAAWEAANDTDKSVLLVVLAPPDGDSILAFMREFNVSATLLSSVSFFESPAFVAHAKEAIRFFEPNSALGETNLSSIEGYTLGRVVSKLTNDAVFAEHWPLTREKFLRALFRLGTVKMEDFSLGPFSNGTLWCNQHSMDMRMVSLRVDRGAMPEHGTETTFRGCGRHEWASVGVVGQTLSMFGMLPSNYATRRAIGVGLVSEPHSDQALSHVATDDGGDPERAVRNVLELEKVSLAIAGVLGSESSLRVMEALPSTVPFIGAMNGHTGLRRPFRRNVVNLRASIHDEVATQVAFFVTAKHHARIALLAHGPDRASESGVVGVTKALSRFGLGLSATVRVERTHPDIPDAIAKFSDAGKIDAFILSTFPAVSFLFLQAATVAFPSADFVFGSINGNDFLGKPLLEKGVRMDNIYFTSVVPPLSSNMAIVQNFLARRTHMTSNSWLEGYIIGRFISEVSRRVLTSSSNVTRETLLNKIYTDQVIPIDDLTFGPFSDACLQVPPTGTCCNQGSSRVWLNRFNATGDAISVAEFNFSLPVCGIDLSDTPSERSKFLEAVVPIAVACVAVALSVCLYLQKKKELTKLELRAQELEERIRILSGDFAVVLGTPAETAIKVLRELKSKPSLDAEDQSKLERIALLIASNKLYTANLVVSKDMISPLDEEVEGFLRELVPRSPTPKISFARSPLPVGGPATAESVSSVRAQLENWSTFHPRNLPVDQQHALSETCFVVLEVHRLFEVLPIDREKFASWIAAIERGYRVTPYHNRMHATDVVQAMHWLIGHSPRASDGHCQFRDIELLAAFVASACHDFGHCGVNNAFLVATLNPLAIRYNGSSVLENMHAAESLRLLLLPANNFVERLGRPAFLEFYDLLVQLVLATDMAKHVALLGEFNAVLAAGSFNFERAADRLLLLKLFIKMSDLSNAARQLDVYSEWTTLLCEEFFAQGDAERERGLPVSAFMDRSTCNVPKMQLAFLGVVVIPLVDALVRVVPAASVLRDGIGANIEHWSKVSNTPQLTAQQGTPRSSHAPSPHA